MDVCYCSNYYSSIRCTNTVGKFGERCKLCTIMNSGASLTPGRLPDDCLWIASQPHQNMDHQKHERDDDHSEKSSSTSRRQSWYLGNFLKSSSSSSSLSKKATTEIGAWWDGRSGAAW